MREQPRSQGFFSLDSERTLETGRRPWHNKHQENVNINKIYSKPVDKPKNIIIIIPQKLFGKLTNIVNKLLTQST